MELHETASPLNTHLALPSGGTLHIVQKTSPSQPAPPCGDADVLVYDDRNCANPSFQIVSSFRIRDKKRMREILQAIMDFNANTPTEPAWNRTLDSLHKEWKLHNLAYRLHIYRSSAQHVDLDNRDQGKGYLHFFFVAAQRVLERIYQRLKRR